MQYNVIRNTSNKDTRECRRRKYYAVPLEKLIGVRYQV